MTITLHVSALLAHIQFKSVHLFCYDPEWFKQLYGMEHTDHIKNISNLFHNGRPCHKETTPLITRANQWTGFYMVGTSVMKELS